MTSVAVRPGPARTAQGVSAEAAETGRLFEEYSGQLLAYCARQLGSCSEAEDAVQTTFLYALRALRRGVVPECEAAWLTTIARNVCHWQRRTRDRRGSLASDIDFDTIGLARPEGDEEGLLVGLKEALASIPENQRRALVLREWQGVPSREIASQLGMSRPATHALLTRARRSLAEALTVARRPVLGIAWMVVELRSHLKAFLGSASAKVAATTVAVVGVGVGGVAVERSLAEPKAPPAPLRAVDRSAFESTASAPVTHATSRSGLTSGAASENGSTSRTEAVRPIVGPGRPSIIPTVPVTNTGEPAPSPDLVGDMLPPAQELPVDLPVAPPQLPAVDLPTDLVSPVELPPLPTVDLPPLPPLPLPPEDIAPAGVSLP